VYYYLHPFHISQWLWMRNYEEKASRRLGKKISYISLYEYCFIIDKHEKEVAEMKLTIADLQKELEESDHLEQTYFDPNPDGEPSLRKE
jgi:hypothetical protein